MIYHERIGVSCAKKRGVLATLLAVEGRDETIAVQKLLLRWNTDVIFSMASKTVTFPIKYILCSN